MRKKLKTSICLLTLACSSYLSAQELTYKFSPMADQVYQLRGSYAELTSGVIEGLKLPETASPEKLFGQWDVTFAPNGQIDIAVYSSQNDSKYDRLLVDTNANGSLEDETALASNPTETFGMFSAQFGPVQITLQSEQGPVTRHFKFEFTRYGDRSWLSITSVCWYQGQVSVNGQDMYCMIFDDNANGIFNDTYAPQKRADQIRIGKKGELRTVPLSKYIQIDSEYYSVNIKPSGETIEVSKPENLQFGTVLLPEYITDLELSGENGFYTFTADTESNRAPTGSYYISKWAAERTDEKGDKWQLSAYGAQESIIELLPDTETKPYIGEPVKSIVEAQNENDLFRFSQRLIGKNGERIMLLRDNKMPDAPKLRIKNEDGSYNEEFAFEYG